MRLNPDCIRAVLLCVESSANPDGSFLFRFSDPTGFMDGPTISDPSISINSRDELKGFTEDEVKYHIKQCSDARLITLRNAHITDICVVEDLTPDGHKFLAEIRDDTNWNKIKEKASQIGCLSLNVLSSVASTYISSML